jgi:hypothetical protein
MESLTTGPELENSQGQSANWQVFRAESALTSTSDIPRCLSDEAVVDLALDQAWRASRAPGNSARAVMKSILAANKLGRRIASAAELTAVSVRGPTS